MAARDAVADLRRIAFLLERAGEATPRVRAFRTAADAVAALSAEELDSRIAAGTLRQLPGLGEVTARCVVASRGGEVPEYLARCEATAGVVLDEATAALRAALRGDCHSHTHWSDGGAPLEEMALAAVELGHEYLVVSDHSPRLTVARGLSAAALQRQIDRVAEINDTLPAGFRLLTGIEVDILDDGSLDQDPTLLAQLDVVVASVHSGLRQDRAVMTRRMLRAVENPRVDVLGHCTGRKVPPSRVGAGGGDRAHQRERTRPESDFDAAAVFDACAAHGTAVEVNSRPDRLDPPKRLLRQALDARCLFAIDSDAHAPGQLDWLRYGCERAAQCGVPADRVVNTWPRGQLLAWAGPGQRRGT